MGIAARATLEHHTCALPHTAPAHTRFMPDLLVPACHTPLHTFTHFIRVPATDLFLQFTHTQDAPRWCPWGRVISGDFPAPGFSLHNQHPLTSSWRRLCHGCTPSGGWRRWLPTRWRACNIAPHSLLRALLFWFLFKPPWAPLLHSCPFPTTFISLANSLSVP